MLPASRMPRRLPSVMTAIELTPMSTLIPCSGGKAEEICSTAEEVETETVSM